jgi:xylulokinase
MAKLLALDIGSSSVIAGLLDGTKVVREAPRIFYPSQCRGAAVDVRPEDLLAAVYQAVAGLELGSTKIDAVQFAVMAPAWLAMDKNGVPLTPLVTHQDRRSLLEAREIEARVGKARHLRITGNRPFPGGISSTSLAWFQKNEPARLKKADLFGHLNTFLHRQWTGARVIDPSNASFTGLYETMKLGGWSKQLCEVFGLSSAQLPAILEADEIAGKLLPAAAKKLGLPAGTPVMTGLMDGSAGMLRAGAVPGRLFNVCGSTDVLALCTDRPKPDERLLTRALGAKGLWLQVSTLAAAASSIYWARDQFFREMPIEEFRQEVHRLSKLGPKAAGGVTFAPYMAGERTNLEQRTGSFDGINLATKREHLLAAIIEGLVKASAERLPILEKTGTPLLQEVMVSGGSDRLDKILHRDWVGSWKFRSVTDATMRGLGLLPPRF